MTDVGMTYRSQYQYLQQVAAKLRDLLADHLAETPHIDRVTARAKAPERLDEKAAQLDEANRPKYVHPLTEIQDVIGARIVVFYRSDIDSVSKTVQGYFPAIEVQSLVPESEWTFGYFGRHFVLSLPGDAIPTDVSSEIVPAFFELQIKTLFQHAWSEANHDMGYKSPRELEDDQRRRLAFTAAQAWGADHIFEELDQELRSIRS